MQPKAAPCWQAIEGCLQSGRILGEGKIDELPHKREGLAVE
jgi:hypothetical protein